MRQNPSFWVKGEGSFGTKKRIYQEIRKEKGKKKQALKRVAGKRNQNKLHAWNWLKVKATPLRKKKITCTDKR